MQKIKVMQVISDSNIGGAGKVLLNMLECFDKNKIDCKIIIPNGSRLKDFIKDLGYDIIEINNLGESSFDYELIKIFISIFKCERPDIIHTHASLSARIAAKILGIKIIYTRHWLGGEKTNFLLKLINNYFCDAAIAVSQATVKSLIMTGISEKKISVVYNGIKSLKKYSEIEKKILRNKYNLGDEFIVGTILRLEKIKGIKYFIDAANKFLDYNPNAKFLIFGDGTLKNNLENYVHELKRENKIIFMGFIKNTQEALNLLDIFILPSIQEALSLALIEAMSVGCACIATDCGGPSEIINNKNNGLLVPIKNSDAILYAIKFLFENNSLRDRISKNAVDTVSKKFLAQNMTDKIIKIYERLVKKNV